MNAVPPPKELLALTVKELGPLAQEVVFVGGSVIPLAAIDLEPSRARFTEDVDVVIEALTKTDYDRFDSRLRKQGFQNDVFGPICRYKKGILTLDVVPTKGEILGFENKWYSEGFQKAFLVELAPEMEIRVIFPPCLIASKLSAFQTPYREGAGDLLASRDFVDIVTVLAYRPTIVEEAVEGSQELRSYLASSFTELLAARGIEEGIASALDQDRDSQARRPGVLHALRKLVSLAD